MTKKIVVGVDHSDTAAEAAETAAKLAEALDAELYVISAYPKLEVAKISQGSDNFFFSTEAAAGDTVSGIITRLRAQFPKVKFHRHSAEGKPAEAMVRMAEQIGASLIVVGNKRVQGFTRVLGSVAADVAHRAPCDVYVAHTHD